MNKKTDSEIMYSSIVDRVLEACTKAEKRTWNGAYALAFNCGLGADIDDALKKIKKRWKKELKK